MGLCLLLGLATRYAALAAAGALLLATWALHAVAGWGWFWNLGGMEYLIF